MKAVHTKKTTATHPPSNNFRDADEPVPNLLLRNARKQNGWAQQEVADKIRAAAVSVGRWERGEVVPNRYDRDLLCELFHKSAEELGFPGVSSLPVSEKIQPPDQFSGGSLEPGRTRLAMKATSMEKQSAWHQILRHERILRGWGQAYVAEKIGSDVKTVARWEAGKSFPSPYFRTRLIELYEKSAKELELIRESTPQSIVVPTSLSMSTEARRFHTTRTLTIDLPVPCGDCEQPGITAILNNIVIDPSKDCTTFYLRFTNRTAEDAGLRFESLSLTDPSGDFFLGQSVGSFLLDAGQSIRLSAVFDWIPQRKIVYKLNIVLIRPDRWRNTYRPIPLTF